MRLQSCMLLKRPHRGIYLFRTTFIPVFWRTRDVGKADPILTSAKTASKDALRCDPVPLQRQSSFMVPTDAEASYGKSLGSSFSHRIDCREGPPQPISQSLVKAASIGKVEFAPNGCRPARLWLAVANTCFGSELCQQSSSQPTYRVSTSRNPKPLNIPEIVLRALSAAILRMPSCSAACWSWRSASSRTSLSRLGSGEENSPVSREYTFVLALSIRVLKTSAAGR